jgi:hypothetical protein
MSLIISKIIIFTLCFCSLNLLREIYTFYQCFSKMETYNVSDKRMIGLWASISFILTIIFSGI